MDDDVLESEVDDILRELLRAPGTFAAALAGEAAPPPALQELAVAPGDLARIPVAPGRCLWVAHVDPPPPELPPAIKRAERGLMSCLRRHTVDQGADQAEQDAVPFIRWGAAPRGKAALLRRIETFLAAFQRTHGASAVILLRGPNVVAAAGDANEARRDRLPFLRKRLDAEAARSRGKTSHAELTGEDVFACSFWFDAYLFLFFDAPWSVDFVRYRARNVARDLSLLLPHLDDDPPNPANVLPLPPRT